MTRDPYAPPPTTVDPAALLAWTRAGAKARRSYRRTPISSGAVCETCGFCATQSLCDFCKDDSNG